MSKTKASTQLASLVPNAIRVKNDDGEEVFVASDRAENKLLSMVVAAQMRALLQTSMKTYNEKGMTPTPKELKELTEAARNIAEMSDAIYVGTDGLPEKKDPKNVTGSSMLDDLSFDNLKPNGNKDVQPDKPADNGGKVD